MLRKTSIFSGMLILAASTFYGCGGSSDGGTPYALFPANTGVDTGYELSIFKDGEISLVKDIFPGEGSSECYGYTKLGGKIFFAANDGTHGYELWVTDGTEAGTSLVKDINPDGSSGPVEITAFDGKVYFQADDGSSGEELWVSDGTAAGTVMLKDINPGEGSSSPEGFVAYDGKLYFQANDGDMRLYRTDGTVSGTARFGNYYVPDTYFSFLKVYRGKLLFNSDLDVDGYSLMSTDGTVSGTVELKAGLLAYDAAEMDGKLYMAADDDSHGLELWVTGGTTATTSLLKDINTAGGSGPADFTLFNGKLYFSAYDETHGWEPWVSDGTTAGTVILKDIKTGEGAGSEPRCMNVFGGKLYFAAEDGTTDMEPWVSDGTESGTHILKDINASGGSWPYSLSTLKNFKSAYVSGSFDKLYFVAYSQATGSELWETNGTETGTKIVADYWTGPNSGIMSGD